MRTTLRLITICLLALISGSAFAQNAHFTTSGTIEYEKSINMYAFLKKRIKKSNESYMQPAYESFRKSQPQFKKLKSELTFDGNKTLYKPLPDDGPSNGWFNTPLVQQTNTVGADLATGTFATAKTVYEENFLVKDSLRKINWKITDETREIAGFACRRANALIMDSIYVVAFYTDQIAVSGGPESFTGLPGMILGVALPHENITWFATKVTDMPVVAKNVAPPAKGKPVNNKQLAATLQEAMKDWGEYAQEELKGFTL
jgi:GLPGLI family protein